jgi:acyl dehydratase
MIFEGVITYIGPEETVGQNALPKRSFVVQENTDKQYKDTLMIDLLKDKIEFIKPYRVGDVVKVYLSTRANEYNGKYFNSIGAWKIEGQASGGGKSAPATSSSTDDDLPF